MTQTPPPKAKPQDLIRQSLTDAGFSAAAAAALLSLDADHFAFMRRVMKGDVPQSLMEELGAGLEPGQFQALSAIMRLHFGHGRPAEEATVGALAEEMCLDPSRASRIAADLVDRGLLARAVSQSDGRRSVLAPTPAALALMQGFLRAKWARTIRLFQDWDESDITTFARLFARYSEGMAHQYPRLKDDPAKV